MDFEVIGCELFGYDNHFRPVGQVSLKPQHDETECLRALARLPVVTKQAQVVMFLKIGERDVRLYSAMLPVMNGVVSSTGSISDLQVGTDKNERQVSDEQS